MLLLHNYIDETVSFFIFSKMIFKQTLPMTLIKVNNGEKLMNFKFSKISKEIEFLEQFNEKIMLKTCEKELVIFNTKTNEKIKVKNFNAPEAFIFLYDQDKILTLKDG